MFLRKKNILPKVGSFKYRLPIKQDAALPADENFSS